MKVGCRDWGGVRDETREQLLRWEGLGGFGSPSALIAMISFDCTTVL